MSCCSTVEARWRALPNAIIGALYNNLQATLADCNRDLYIANDWARDYLFGNDDSACADVAGTIEFGVAVRASWGHCDSDGLQDLCVFNMFRNSVYLITASMQDIDGKYQQSGIRDFLLSSTG